MASLEAEQQNISALNLARKDNEQNQESKSGSPSSSRTVDFSEFLMWETGLAIFWLILAGWVPFWGGAVNAILIGIIYIWYAANDLNPPSFSPTKATKFAGEEEILKKIPGGGTLMFILAVLSGGVGIIPTPMVLFFSIYLANNESDLLKLAPKQGGAKLAGGKQPVPKANPQKTEAQKQSPITARIQPQTTQSDETEKLRRMMAPGQTKPDWMRDTKAAEGAKRDQERFEVAKRLGMSGEGAAKKVMDIREKE